MCVMSPSVLILYNRPQPDPDPARAESERGVLAEVAAVRQACQKLRCPVRCVGVSRFQEIPDVLACAEQEVVFNLVEGFWQNDEWAHQVPTLCLAFGKACTGNTTEALLLSLDKWQSKALLMAAGLPCPRAVRVPLDAQAPHDLPFPGPYLVKPAACDASEGIDRNSVFDGFTEATVQRVKQLQRRFDRDVLIEQYIDGRELNISVLWRHGQPEVLPLAEIDFSDFDDQRPRIVGYEAKWLADSFEYRHTPRRIPAPLPPSVADRLRTLAVAACRTLKITDYARVDCRLDRDLNPYILEVNANPDISPEAGLAAALTARHIGYHEFIRLTLHNALERRRRAWTAPARLTPAVVTRPPGTVTLRPCVSQDREPILAFLAQTRFFRPNELAIAREVLDDSLGSTTEGTYHAWVACRGQEVVGWICFGPTAGTVGTWDIYWVAVSPAFQGQGVGRTLMAHAEEKIGAAGGRHIVIETSGRPLYQPTLAFYQALGYERQAEIPDFYDTGDAKVIFTKRLPPY